MDYLRKWYGHEFMSSSTTTPEWISFAKDFKKSLKNTLTSEYELVDFSRGHFYVSGFIKNKTTEKLAYFNISDVRWNRDWASNILVRTAKHIKDYAGGRNNFTNFDNLNNSLNELVGLN